jgi:hypothetical protein
MNQKHDHVSWAMLDEIDPNGTDRRRMCPIGDCSSGKPKDMAHRSFAVNPDTGLWRCWRCYATGKLIDFWENRSNVQQDQKITSIKPYIRYDFVGPSTLYEPTPEPVKTPPSSWLVQQPNFATDYLASRGISYKTAIAAGTGFTPSFYWKPAAVFYMYDMDANVIACQGRFTVPVPEGQPSSITVGPKANGIFHTTKPTGPRWVHKIPFAILCEAPIDALSLAEVGYPAFAYMGTSAPDWVTAGFGLKRVFLAFDADEAGDKAAKRTLSQLRPYGAHCVRLRPPVEGSDWNQLLQNYGASWLADWVSSKVLPEI